MSRALQSQGKFSQAEIVLLRLIKEYGDFVPSYSDLAGLRVQQGRLDEAVALLDAGAKLAPNDPIILNNRGICLLMKGDAEGALPCFEKAAERDPQSGKYRANAALALGMLRRDEESLERYKEVVPVAEGQQNLDVIRNLRSDADKAAAAPAEVTEPAKDQAEAERAAQQEAERVAAEEAARVAAQQETERLAAEEAARVAAQQEAERVAAEEAARVAAQQEAERVAAEEAARVAAQQEAERVAAEEAARVAAQQETERVAAEEAARLAARQVA
ncbi:MAG: tetratricopeptide repeat protein, partial [Acidobacteria bacterium]|nr:tetratricopeptide repeat protein [Acidobacteriota bacterium]